MVKEMNEELYYWYAVGYYEGRSFGAENSDLSEDSEEIQLAYKRGYTRGVEDFCEYDENS